MSNLLGPSSIGGRLLLPLVQKSDLSLSIVQLAGPRTSVEDARLKDDGAIHTLSSGAGDPLHLVSKALFRYISMLVPRTDDCRSRKNSLVTFLRVHAFCRLFSPRKLASLDLQPEQPALVF